MTDELKPLSKKHQRVLDEYLLCFNATAAYRQVYTKSTYEAARANSSRLLAGDNFKAHLEARLAEAHMSADEALKLLADMARGDIGQFMETSSMGFELDIDAAKKAGLTKIIKKIRQQTITINGKEQDKEIHTQEIELYDAQAAIDKVLKIHGKYSDAPTVNINMSWKDFVSGINNTTTGNK